MPNRANQDRDFEEWLRRLGQRLKAARKALNLTQPQAADRCGIAFKQYQDYEDGRRAASLRTLYVLVHGLGVDADTLLGLALPDAGAAAPARDLLAPLLAQGWRQPRKGQTGVPVYDLQAAVGPHEEVRAPAVLARLLPPRERRRRSLAGLFLAQVCGAAMAPAVLDGAWCLFRRPVAPPLLGKVVLLRCSTACEGESDAIRLRRVDALRLADDCVHVTLAATNPAFAPMELRVATEADVQALGEFVDVAARP